MYKNDVRCKDKHYFAILQVENGGNNKKCVGRASLDAVPAVVPAVSTQWDTLQY